MHCQIRVAREHRALHLLDEDTLAPDLRQRNVGASVALGTHWHDLDLQSFVDLPQQSGNVVGLPPRQVRRPGGNPQHGFRSRALSEPLHPPVHTADGTAG